MRFLGNVASGFGMGLGFYVGYMLTRLFTIKLLLFGS